MSTGPLVCMENKLISLQFWMDYIARNVGQRELPLYSLKSCYFILVYRSLTMMLYKKGFEALYTAHLISFFTCVYTFYNEIICMCCRTQHWIKNSFWDWVDSGWNYTTGILKTEQTLKTLYTVSYFSFKFRENWASCPKQLITILFVVPVTTNSRRNMWQMKQCVLKLAENIKHVWYLLTGWNQRLKLKNLSLWPSYICDFLLNLSIQICRLALLATGTNFPRL